MRFRGAREPSATTTRRRKRLLSSDRILTLAGFALAAGAAFLPWYALMGGQGLGIRNDHLRLLGHAMDGRGHGAVPSSGERADARAMLKDLDETMTGTVPQIGETLQRAKEHARPQEQPFPGRPFRVVHVANGQALISDGSGIYLVGVGSKLPDNSLLKTFAEKDGHWVIVTSNGDTIGP